MRSRNNRLDALLLQGAQEQDRAKRQQLYRDVQDIIHTQALMVPLWYRANIIGLRSNVREVYVEPRGYLQLYNTWLAKA